jgi:hypothetical protein
MTFTVLRESCTLHTFTILRQNALTFTLPPPYDASMRDGRSMAAALTLGASGFGSALHSLLQARLLPSRLPSAVAAGHWCPLPFQGQGGGEGQAGKGVNRQRLRGISSLATSAPQQLRAKVIHRF